ncbi:MAG: tryptophan--tRNA ligase, partial [Candidatus Omnitrophica bacterium]|nr:tryptophan--tRNA ligase [Candidatus Omnitrophota bacterium]
CTECKAALAEVIIGYLGPIQDKRNALENADIDKILKDGEQKAREIAGGTIREVKKAVFNIEQI